MCDNYSSAAIIRAAGADQAQVLSDLALRSKAHWGYSKEFIEMCRVELSYSEQQIGSADMRFFVLEVENAPAGFYALKQLSAATIELDSLFVEPALIGQGLGRKLLDHARHIAAELGATQMIIQSDPNADSFYLAAGAKLTGKRESASTGRTLSIFTIELDSPGGGHAIDIATDKPGIS